MWIRASEQQHEKQGLKPALEECWFLAGEVEHYTRDQMREVYAGILGYQNERCIKLYSSHHLTPNQMHEIRHGIENGLSYEEVLTYSNAKLPWQEMKRIRQELQDRRRTKEVRPGDEAQKNLRDVL